MGAFLTSLLSIGNQAGEAKSELAQERLARQEKLRRMDAEDAYLQIARQREDREAAAQKEAMDRGEIFPIRGRLWSVKQNKFIDPAPPDPYAAFKDLLATVPTDLKAGAIARMRAVTAADPNNPKAGIEAGLQYLNAQQAEQNRREDAATKHTEHEEDIKESEKFRTEERKGRESFQREMRQDQRDFVKNLTDLKRQGLTPGAEKVLYSTEPVVQQVDRLLADIKRLGLEKNNQNGYLLSGRLKYALGGASREGTLASDIAGLSLGSVIEAASAIQGTSRSLAALKLASTHTPNAWKDSPMLINQKLTEIRKRLVDIMADARKYGTKSGMFNEPDVQQGPVDIDKVLDSIPSLGGVAPQ